MRTKTWIELEQHFDRITMALTVNSLSSLNGQCNGKNANRGWVWVHTVSMHFGVILRARAHAGVRL